MTQKVPANMALTQQPFPGAVVRGNDIIGMTPLRLENDTQDAPAAPQNPIVLNNTWLHTGGFISSLAVSGLIAQDNILRGVSNVAIVAGVVTIPTGVRNITIDTEAASAADDLDTINGGSPNDFIFIRAQADTRTVTLKDATGNLRLAGDFALTHGDDVITLRNLGGIWAEVSRSDNSV